MTRDEYMQQSRDNGPVAHRAYYGQFVNHNTIKQVVRHIGADRIKASTNPHFNDIPLEEWDNLTKFLIIAKPFKSVGDYTTLAGLVCVAKEAARQFKESN
jgi:hypothetical protein